MANTTVRGAQAIHGQNPQVIPVSLELCSRLICYLVPRRDRDPQSYI
jgi:hypothetical protein